jgi:uncharacterized protein (TIGR03083 family)
MTGDGAALPQGLRERVLAASRRARAVGRPVPDVPELSAEEVFSRAADAFYGMLAALDDEDWSKPALRGLDVQGLVGHLIGVERDVHRALGGDPEVAGAGHVESTQGAAERKAGRRPADTRSEWRRAVDTTLELVHARGQAADGEVAVHGLRLPLRALLIARAFELWTHENDIRLVTGLPPSVPDAAALRLMCHLAVRLLPYAVARAGLPEAADVHMVLTGPGGGTWDVTVGERQPDPVAVSIVIDAVGFCRLAANRVTPGELDVHISGDPDCAAGVLAATATLALD